MSSTGVTGGMYQCGVCKAEYGRPDHLIRHVRGHTKQRPFICSTCGKGFARQDLLKRHVSTHDAEDISNLNSEATAQSRRSGQRVHQACRLCASKKLKCTDQKPCKRCRQAGIACEYDQESVYTSPIVESGIRDQVQSEPEIRNQGRNQLTPQSTVILGHQQSQIEPFETNSDDGMLQNSAMLAQNRPFTTDLQTADPMPVQNSFMQDILDGTLNISDFGGFIEMDPDLVMEDIDFSFLNNMGTQNYQPSPGSIPIATTIEMSPNSPTTGVGIEAYRMSHVLKGWQPGKEENDEVEHQNLILPQNVRPESLNPSVKTSAIVKNNISLSMRDRILSMILRTASGKTADRILRSFPSLEVLRDLINLAFVRMADLQAVPIIHSPSLDLNEQRPELLGALIAYGSINSSSPPVRAFGYAVQETVRIAINQLFEKEHATFRELGVLQAFYIQLYLGYYSGISRKIEMAESSSMLGVTVLRRGRMLQRKEYTLAADFLNLPGLTLQQKWMKWVDQESQKRLVYFAFIMDSHVSTSRNIGVLFPYSELETPLPTNERLWEAQSASEWRDLLQRNQDLQLNQPLSLCTILRQPHLITSQKSIADMTCVCLAFLAGFWGLVSEYQQMNSVLRPNQSWNDFVLNSRYSELNSTLEQFRAEIADLDEIPAEVLILHAFMGLHLDVAFYELSKFAGISTPEDAQSALPYVQKWFDSPQSRTALWHAGQIYRATRLLTTNSLTDIYVIALYHAGIILWVWGLLQRAQSEGSGLNQQRVVLDGEENPTISRYLKASRTLPGLTTSSGEFMSLDNLTAAADLGNDIIMANWCLEPLPLTAEEVSRLWKGISRICRQRFKEAIG